jgi:hypothetical protein
MAAAAKPMPAMTPVVKADPLAVAPVLSGTVSPTAFSSITCDALLGQTRRSARMAQIRATSSHSAPAERVLDPTVTSALVMPLSSTTSTVALDTPSMNSSAKRRDRANCGDREASVKSTSSKSNRACSSSGAKKVSLLGSFVVSVFVVVTVAVVVAFGGVSVNGAAVVVVLFTAGLAVVLMLDAVVLTGATVVTFDGKVTRAVVVVFTAGRAVVLMLDVVVLTGASVVTFDGKVTRAVVVMFTAGRAVVLMLDAVVATGAVVAFSVLAIVPVEETVTVVTGTADVAAIVVAVVVTAPVVVVAAAPVVVMAGVVVNAIVVVVVSVVVVVVFEGFVALMTVIRPPMNW